MASRQARSPAFDPGALPSDLYRIYEAANQPRPATNLNELRPTWADHVARAKQQVPTLHIENGGETVVLGELSPGCQACKQGTWDCVFTTAHCPLECDFCYSPHAIPGDYQGSLLGSSPEEILTNHARTRITGVSFSGGEPFADPEGLFSWVEMFSIQHPEYYTWVYTNGLLASAEHLRRLAALGVDEVRFDVAATGYDHPQVMEHMAVAARIMPNVTVEIPAIPEHSAKVLGCLSLWARLGVRYLNLHELIYEPGSNSWQMAGARQELIMQDGHRCAFNPESRRLTLAVMRRVRDEGLRLSVNDCSMQSKLCQLRGRRRCVAPIVAEHHEVLVGDEELVSYRAYRNGDEPVFVSPDALHEMQHHLAGYRFVKLSRTAPLSPWEGSRWTRLEPVGALEET